MLSPSAACVRTVETETYGRAGKSTSPRREGDHDVGEVARGVVAADLRGLDERVEDGGRLGAAAALAPEVLSVTRDRTPDAALCAALVEPPLGDIDEAGDDGSQS